MATTAEYGLGEFTYPRGWFMVGRSEDATTTPLAVRYFGQDMVLYRGHSGRVVLMEAYCPHMGTHLAKNTSSYVVVDGKHVEGDDIRCPYHAWRFGPDGRCNDIPYSPAPPPKKACVKSWPIVEKGGALWTWHDEEGGTPDYELPAFQCHGQPGWINWSLECLGEIACHPQEVVDNMTDKCHLGPVHGSEDMLKFENEFEGIKVRQILRCGSRYFDFGEGECMLVDTHYTGPGILLSMMTRDEREQMFIANTPVDDGVVKVWYGLAVEAGATPPTEAEITEAKEREQISKLGFMQDFEIWANKQPCLSPMMVPSDGPFDKLRIWYKQFYNPRARAGEFHARVNGHYVTRGTIEDPWEEVA